MSSTRLRMGVQPGAGIVGRFGDLAVVCGVGGDADLFARSLLDLLAVGTADAATLWRVADLLTTHGSAAPPFGLVADLEDDPRLLLHGSARAILGSSITSGADALTWVDRPLPADATTVGITITPSGPLAVDPQTDLGHGMLVGSGFLLEALTGGSEMVAPPPPPTRERVATVARAPANETVTLAHELAYLVADDGSRVPLDRAYVLGRDPRQDPAVRRGAASPVFIPDLEQTVSRVQAYVDVAGDVLTVLDAGSINGTHVAAPGDEEWTRLGTDPFRLPPEWSLRIGRRVYTYVMPGAAPTR